MSQDFRSGLLSAEHSQLVVIDVQEKLLPAICHQHNIVSAIRFLMDAAAILKVSAILTEQYPKGLGPTVESLRNHPATARTLEKLRFSAAEVLMHDAWSLQASNPTTIQIPSQVVLAGIETHVCVQQTALDLRKRGFEVFVAADCVGSRFSEDRDWGLHRMADAGVIITTGEAVAFEWCERADHDRFRILSRIIRERDIQRKR